MKDRVKLVHGDGAEYTRELIDEIFLKSYGSKQTNTYSDSFIFCSKQKKYAFTTDSFVVHPLFFNGGDIGKLSVCGTVNDLAAAGALPVFLSISFIIEEGFEFDKLKTIARSIAKMCKKTKAKIVTGDTKVVEKGSADGVYINTAGIGEVSEFYQPQIIEPKDEILVTGSVGNHGAAILTERYGFDNCNIKSDCNPLDNLITTLGDSLKDIKLMRDPTRGGLATVLNEFSVNTGYDIELYENKIPIENQVRAVNNILGTDPLYLACEGRMVLVVKKDCGVKVLNKIKELEDCHRAKIIGGFVTTKSKMVYIIPENGGKRLLRSFREQSIPRIC